MPSLKSIVSTVVVGFVAIASALPAQPKLSERALNLMTRQNAAAAAAGLNDVDILTLSVPLALAFS